MTSSRSFIFYQTLCREYRAKLESVLKQGKAPRGVVDETFVRVSINAVLGYIVDYILFGEHPDVSEPAVVQPNLA